MGSGDVYKRQVDNVVLEEGPQRQFVLLLQEVHNFRIAVAPGGLGRVDFLNGRDQLRVGGVAAGGAAVVDAEDRSRLLDEDVVQDRVIGTAGDVNAAPLSHEDVPEDEGASRTVVGIVAADRVMDEVVADHDAAERPVEPGVESPRVGRVVGAAVHLVELVDIVVAAIEEGITGCVMDEVVGHVAADHTLVALCVVHETGRVDRRRVLGLEGPVVMEVIVDNVVARVLEGHALAGVAVDDHASLSLIHISEPTRPY